MDPTTTPFAYTWKGVGFNASPFCSRYAHSSILLPRLSSIVSSFGLASGAPPFDGTCLNDTYSFNSDSFMWDSISVDFGEQEILPRSHTAACAIGDYEILYSCGVHNKSVLDETVVLKFVEPKRAQWIKIPSGTSGTSTSSSRPFAQSPSGRLGHAAANINGRCYIYGGKNASNSNCLDLWYFDPAKMQWYTVESPKGTPPGARLFHIAVNDGKNNLVVMGGSGDTAQTSNIYSFDARCRTWNEIVPCEPLPARMGHSASVLDDGTLMVVGGRGVGPAENLMLIDLSDPICPWRYAVLEGAGIEARSFFGSVASTDGNGAFIVGGYKESSHGCTNSVWKLTRVANPRYIPGSEARVGPRTSDTSPIRRGVKPPSPRPGSAGSKNNTSKSLIQHLRDWSTSSSVDGSVSVSLESFRGVAINEEIETDKSVCQIDDLIGAFARTKGVSESMKQRDFIDKAMLATARRIVRDIHAFADRQPQYPTHGQSAPCCISESDMIFLCAQVEEIFENEPVCLRVQAPVKVFGDVHGQLHDLMEFFRQFRAPEEDIPIVNYLFLGDYVDRGCYSLETIFLLFAYKVLYRNRFFMIRGNHEEKEIQRTYGFRDECITRLGEQGEELWEMVNKVFMSMPIAAVVSNRIFCCHGGLGPDFKKISQLNAFQRPIESTYHDELLRYLFWSDPSDSDEHTGVRPNPRGDGLIQFGPDIVRRFCKENKLSCIIRAHQCVKAGFELFAGGHLVTVFSATNYCGRENNNGAMLMISSDLLLSFKVVRAKALPSDSQEYEYGGQSHGRPPSPARDRGREYSSEQEVDVGKIEDA